MTSRRDLSGEQVRLWAEQVRVRAEHENELTVLGRAI
jgi:hypothetical protein